MQATVDSHIRQMNTVKYQMQGLPGLKFSDYFQVLGLVSSEDLTRDTHTTAGSHRHRLWRHGQVQWPRDAIYNRLWDSGGGCDDKHSDGGRVWDARMASARDSKGPNVKSHSG